MDLITYALSKSYTDKATAVISKGMSYKGSVSTYNDLPISDNKIGDVYTVAGTGMEYVWSIDASSGQLTDWEGLSSPVLSINGETGDINIKSINNNSLMGSGNIDIVSKHTFPNTWIVNGTTEQFCSAIVDDSSAVPGMIYMGKLSCSDLPSSLIQGESTVEIISQDANGKAIRITLTSVDTAPYRWEYERAKVNGNYINTGWVGYQPKLDTQTVYTSKGSSTKVPQITTNNLGQVTNITEVTITDNNDNQKVKTSSVTFGDNDVVEIIGGTNVTVTGDASAKTITLAATDTTYSTATTASAGLMPQLASSTIATQTQSTKFLREDGTWSAPSYSTAGMSNPMTTAGDLIVGGTDGEATRLGIGSTKEVLTSNGTTASWQPVIPTVTIEVTQIVGQNPLEIQLTNDQYDIFRNNNQVLVDLAALGESSVVWSYVEDDVGSFSFGFFEASLANVFHRIAINKTSKVATYLSRYKQVLPENVGSGMYEDAGKLLAMDVSGWGTLTNNLPILTTAPSSANTEGGIIIVVLTSEPATYYDGYYYIITEA